MKNANNMYLVIRISEGTEKNIDVFPRSESSADVYISASSMDEAKELMSKAEAMAGDVMASYTEPPKKEPKEEKHYHVAPVAEEDAKKEIAKYKQTVSGKRFYKEIENGMHFMRKKDRGLGAVDAGYLALEAYADSPFTPIMYAYDLAYKRGYAAGKREEKAKHNKAI